jgi:hypothetical protein
MFTSDETGEIHKIGIWGTQGKKGIYIDLEAYAIQEWGAYDGSVSLSAWIDYISIPLSA